MLELLVWWLDLPTSSRQRIPCNLRSRQHENRANAELPEDESIESKHSSGDFVDDSLMLRPVCEAMFTERAR